MPGSMSGSTIVGLLVYPAALAVAVAATAPTRASDFLILSGVGALAQVEPVYAPVPAPWGDASFAAEFPDVGFLREARVDAWPSYVQDDEKGSGSATGQGGTGHIRARDLAAGIRAPKFKIKVRPGF